VRHLANSQPVPCMSGSTSCLAVLTQVCALLDTHITSYGFIRSFLVCFFIPFFVLDLLLVLLAFYLMPLPLDTELSRSFRPCTHCHTFNTPFIPTLSLITIQFLHTTPHGLSPAGLQLLKISFSASLFLFPPPLHLLAQTSTHQDYTNSPRPSCRQLTSLAWLC